MPKYVADLRNCGFWTGVGSIVDVFGVGDEQAFCRMQRAKRLRKFSLGVKGLRQDSDALFSDWCSAAEAEVEASGHPEIKKCVGLEGQCRLLPCL